MVGALLLVGTSSTAASAEEQESGLPQVACWGSLETGESVCAPDDASLSEVLLEDFDIVRVDSVDEARAFNDHAAQNSARSSGAAAPQAVVRGITLYEGASLSGSYLDLTFNQFSGQPCGGSSAWLGQYKRAGILTWDDTVSSFQVRVDGCYATAYKDSDYRGQSYGKVRSADAVGLNSRGLNKAISSIKVTS